MKPRPNGRLVSVRNAADELGLAYHTVYEWVQRGFVPVVRPVGSRSLYLDRRDLEKLIDDWKETAR